MMGKLTDYEQLKIGLLEAHLRLMKWWLPLVAVLFAIDYFYFDSFLRCKPN